MKCGTSEGMRFIASAIGKIAVVASALCVAMVSSSSFAETPDALVEYIESSGTQYIDTGIEASADTKAEFKMRWTETPGNDWMFLGARAHNGNNRFYYLYTYRKNFYYGFGSGKGNAGSFKPSAGTDYNFSVELTSDKHWKATVSGDNDGPYDYDCSASTESLDSGVNIFAFACNNNGSGVCFQSKARCYYIRIWKSGALVRDFVPCVKNGRAGLYDRVSKGIFHSQVEGADFSAEGAGVLAVHGEPDSMAEYVEATGTQYIDTGVEGRRGAKTEMHVAWMEFDGYQEMLGAATTTNRCNLCDINGTRPSYSYGNKYGLFTSGLTSDITAGAIYHVVSEAAATEILTINSVIGVRNDAIEVAADFTSGCSLYLFARNNSVAADLNAKARLYDAKIWLDGTLVRNYAPCLKDGSAGLYDSVSGMVFFGLGADLLRPPVTDAPPDAFLDYVESTGSQYIDTEIVGRCNTSADMTIQWLSQPDGSFLGSRLSGNGNGRFILCSNDRNKKYYTGHRTAYWGNQIQCSTSEPDRIQTSITHDGTDATITMTINGNEATATRTEAALDTELNMYLFAQNHGGNVELNSSVRCYSVKIWQDGNLVRDFRPCIKNGIAGLYDDVSHTIFYPKFGTLVAGPESGAVPAKFVDYVESTDLQYVDTGVTARYGTKTESTFAMNADFENKVARTCLLAAWGSGTGNERRIEFCWSGKAGNSADRNVGAYFCGVQTYWGGGGVDPVTYTFRSELTTDNKSFAYHGGRDASSTKPVSVENADIGVNLYAFACNDNGKADQFCKAKLYAMNIWQADDMGDYRLVRAFRPCVTTNGVAALYDKVSRAIFHSQGGLLATGGVERTASVTARWIGGAVAEAADLSVSANWECYDVAGGVVADAVPSAATTVFVEQGSPLLSLPAGVAVQDWAGVTLTNSVTLSAACDWSALGLITLANGVTVNLNGNDLASGGFAVADGDAASVANSGASATLALDVADGNTATFDGISLAGDIALAKTGAGKLSITNSPAWSAIAVSNGTFAVFGASSNWTSAYLAKNAVLDLGGGAATCGTLSGAGTVTNGTFVATASIVVSVGEPLTFQDVALTVSDAYVVIADPENITGRDPVLVAVSGSPIAGRMRTTLSGRKVQTTQDEDVYKIELVRRRGFVLTVR